MGTVGERLKTLRAGVGLSQNAMAKLMGVTQSSVNRYENNDAQAPYRVLVWYADYFDVSLDYIFARTDNPKGKELDPLEKKVSGKKDWNEFVEACFEPGSTMNQKFKELLLNMMEGGEA